MTKALRKGAKGADVRTLQEALAKLGQTVRTDGDFGNATDLALRNYQRKNGLVADGIAGPRTLNALGIKASPLKPKKTTKENLQDIMNRVSLSPVQAATAQSFRPITTESKTPGAIHTSDDGIRFIYNHEALATVSNRLHWPGGASGVTLGPGYDMKERHPKEIKSDLISIGLSPGIAETVSEGSGLTAQDAKYFCGEHHNLVDLPYDQELKLLKRIAPHYEGIIKRQIHIDLMQYEFDALVCFVYNPGGDVRPISHQINSGNIIDAMIAIKRRIVSGGTVPKGLITRREDEVNLFLFGSYGKLR